MPPAVPAPPRSHSRLLALLFVLCLAMLSAQLSFRVRDDRLDEDIRAEFAVLDGKPTHLEFQNRVIAPASLWLLRRVLPAGVADHSVWYAARFLQAAAGYLLLYAAVMALTGGRLRALAATSLVAYAYVWTPLTHPWEYTSDFLDIGLTALMAWMAVRQRPLAMAGAVALAALNRESAAFGGLLWMALVAAHHGADLRQWRRLLTGGLFCLLAAAVVLAVRHAFGTQGVSQQIGIFELLNHWRWLLHPTGSVPIFAATVLVYAVLLLRLPRPWLADQRGLLWGALASAAITLVFGIAAELRVWLPCWTMLAIALTLGPPGQSDRDWLLGLCDRRR